MISDLLINLAQKLKGWKEGIKAAYQAVLEKGGDITNDLSIANLPAAIHSIKPHLENKTITSNGKYTASEEFDGLGEVEVNLKQLAYIPNIQINEKHIQNGRWLLDSMIDTALLTYTNNMIYNCTSLTQLDTSGWKMSNVKSANNMFYGCSNLTTIDVSTWDCSLITSAINIFIGCKKLTSIIGNRTLEEVLEQDIKALNGWSISISFSDTLLDDASLRAVVNGLAAVSETQTLTLGTTLSSRLTDEEITIIHEKGWTIA